MRDGRRGRLEAAVAARHPTEQFSVIRIGARRPADPLVEDLGDNGHQTIATSLKKTRGSAPIGTVLRGAALHSLPSDVPEVDSLFVLVRQTFEDGEGYWDVREYPRPANKAELLGTLAVLIEHFENSW